MKTLMMLMLASGFLTVPARAEVGRDKSAPNCQQVIQSIQEQLKKSHAANDVTETPAADGAPESGTAQ